MDYNDCTPSHAQSIILKKLSQNGELTDEYIKYLWVKNMSKQKNTTIYIPTEANLPILEAAK
jgi:hypothetical protein